MEDKALTTGADLLDAIAAFVRRFLVLSYAQADVCALWVLHTHAIEAADFTPYLHISSPVLRSGKTLLLEVLRLLVSKPWFTGRVTAAVLVRKVDKSRPTLLLDESDASFQGNRDLAEALRGILNTGFERDGTTSLCVPQGKDWEPRDFSTFCPKAIAGIGGLPNTIEDRAIPIRLKRKLRHEQQQRFRKRQVKPLADELRVQAAAWAAQNGDTLRGTDDPSLPDALNDRQQDVCEPLIAIADATGGKWPDRARRALLELCTSRTNEDDTIGEKLLADVQECFSRHDTDRLQTRVLLDDLRQLEESPWADFQNGRSLAAHGLAKLLRPFGIRPRDLRFDRGIQKGYLRPDFTDAWDRYLPRLPPQDTEEGQQGQQTNVYAGSSGFLEGQQTTDVAASKSEESSTNISVVADVAPKRADDKGEIQGTPMTCWTHSSASLWLREDGSWVCGECHPRLIP